MSPSLVELLDAFEAALDAEGVALRTRDPDALESALARKDRVLAGLAECRPNALDEATRARLRRIRERNEVNGVIIRRTAAANGRLLDLIRGEPAAGGVYGPSGGSRATGLRARRYTA